jgi:hypothetical protein
MSNVLGQATPGTETSVSSTATTEPTSVEPIMPTQAAPEPVAPPVMPAPVGTPEASAAVNTTPADILDNEKSIQDDLNATVQQLGVVPTLPEAPATETLATPDSTPRSDQTQPEKLPNLPEI